MSSLNTSGLFLNSSTQMLTPPPTPMNCVSSLNSTHTLGVGGGQQRGVEHPFMTTLDIPDINKGDKWATISGIGCRRGRFIR